MTLLERLKAAKLDQPGWWMIERDDMELRPMYLSSKVSMSDDVFNWHVGPWSWQQDWSKGLRFATKEDADVHFGQWHFDQDRDQMHIRSHGMMTEYYNPDGPEAVDLIETLSGALRRLRYWFMGYAANFETDVAEEIALIDAALASGTPTRRAETPKSGSVGKADGGPTRAAGDAQPSGQSR